MSKSPKFIPTLILLIIVSASPLFGQHNTARKKEVVVLLHGLGRGKSAMQKLQSWLTEAGFDVKMIDYKSLDRPPDQVLEDVTAQINAIPIDSHQTVHFVGHSLGGLLIRAYLDSNTVPTLGRVVLIGSPNKGTPLVDYFRDAWFMKLIGPTAIALGTDEKSFPRTLRPPYYPVGVIAGISHLFDNEDFIPGDDDGVVPVESTKIEGMTDFILLKVSHSSLPRHELVARQVIAFLQNGRFLKEDPGE